MRRHKALAVVTHEREQVGALLRREIDFADAEKEDGVEVVEVAREKLLARGDARASLELNGMFGDRLRVGANDRVVETRLPAQALDGRERMRDRLVLIAITHIGPGEDVFGEGLPRRCRGCRGCRRCRGCRKCRRCRSAKASETARGRMSHVGHRDTFVTDSSPACAGLRRPVSFRAPI